MPRKSRKNVGLIGLGIIGGRVAAGLRSAGFQVFVWNRSAKPAPNFLGSPAEVAEACEIIQIFVSDAEALSEVIEAMSDSLTPRHVIVCNATVGPEAVLDAAKQVTNRGAQFLDAPFTGSKTAAEKRELVYYIGGSDAAYLRVKPVLEATSKAIVRIGEIGHASTVKVVTNMISAVTIQTLAEALAIVQKAGLAPEKLGLAIAHNGCRSGVIELKLPKMVTGDYEPHFSLKHMFKDVQLGIHLANTLNIEIPATTVTAGVLYGAINQGLAELDFSALYKVYAPQGRGGVLPLHDKREQTPALPLAEPDPIEDEVPLEKSPKEPTSVLAEGSDVRVTPAGSAIPEPPSESVEPLANAESAETVEKRAEESGEAAKIIEAVIAEFRDVPPLEKGPIPLPSTVEKPPDSVTPEAKDSVTVPEIGGPPNGASEQDAPEAPPRRINFVKRWFVARTRGS